MTLLCRERSLIEVRLLVGLGCTTVALVMGFFLHKFAKRFIEASSKILLVITFPESDTNVVCITSLGDFVTTEWKRRSGSYDFA